MCSLAVMLIAVPVVIGGHVFAQDPAEDLEAPADDLEAPAEAGNDNPAPHVELPPVSINVPPPPLTEFSPANIPAAGESNIPPAVISPGNVEAPAADVNVVPTTEGEATPSVDDAQYYDVAILQGLNKVTARISEIEVAVGTSTRFGTLEIVVQRCWQAPPDERPENAALLEISEQKLGEQAQIIYNGWMFSSSPSLAGLEHPVYDVTVVNCEHRPIDGNT